MQTMLQVRELREWRRYCLYRVFIKYCVFPRILESLPPLHRQHSAAIVCTKITSQ